MTGWAIVAIPRDQEPVMRYSSEKVPHMTLLFLGEQDGKLDVSRTFDYIRHVVENGISPFGMAVERRGELGPDKADVLLFSKDRKDSRGANRLREYLLTDPQIKFAYDSVEQWPEWTPHLTMGYPKTPAKKDERDYGGFGYVEFDRIALWTEEYDGPEIVMHYPQADYEEDSMAMNDRVGAFLAQSGVKGMKWGVRNDKGHEGEQAKTKVIAKADKKYEKSFGGMNGFIKMHNAFAGEMNARLDGMNSKPEYVNYKGKSLIDDGGPVSKKYLKDYEGLVEASAKAAMDSFGTNASGTGRVKLTRVGDGADATFQAEWEEIKHADGAMPVMIITPKFNAKGIIISQSIKIVDSDDDKVEHTAAAENWLEHYGIPGMHWGRRKSESSVADGQTVVTQKKPGTRVTAQGGKKVPASKDAKRAAASRQRAKSSTTDALSNAELKSLVERMNLEQQYSKLSANDVSPGRKFVNKMLGDFAKQQGQAVFNERANGLVNDLKKKQNG